MINYNKKIDECQEVISPKAEIEKRFTPKKIESELLAQSYYRLGYESKAYRVLECGTTLDWGRTASDEFKLYNANFCRDRLCPMCAFRRSYKIFGQVSKIMNVIENDYRFLFLTPTVPTVYGDELPGLIDKIYNAFNKGMCRNKKFKNSVKGFFKSLEVTHDTELYITPKMYKKKQCYYKKLGLFVGDVNPNFDKYHPHLHIVLAVPNSYFNNIYYIKRDEWLKMWQNAMNDPSITQVDIRICKNKNSEPLSDLELRTYKTISSAVSEVAKYSVKSNNYIVENDTDLTDSSVNDLLCALSGRRLCSLGGVFRTTWQALKLDDMENGDLIHIDGEIRKDLFIQIYRYQWTAGAYKLVEIFDNE